MGDTDGELSVEWMAFGSCVTAFPETFYSEVSDDINRAKRICGGCTVKHECLSYALLRNEPFGVWGGHTAAERRRMNTLGSVLEGYTDGLRHQLALREAAPEIAEVQEWSIFPK